jgi:hypothetical protein
MFPAKNLNLTSSRTHPLNHAVRLIRFPTRFSNFAHYNIGVETTICPRWEFEIATVVDVRFDAY